MFKKVFFLFCILLHSKIYASFDEELEKWATQTNYMQIDGFLFDEQITSADKKEYSGSTSQIFTARPALSFYFNWDSYIFRPEIAINPFNSSTEGSIALGHLIREKFELGAFFLLNRDQKQLGESGQQNETVQTHFLLGPYLVFYPYISQNQYFEFLMRLSYDYENEQVTVFGSNDILCDKKGVNFYSSFFYVYKINPRLFFSPSVAVAYSVTADTGGANTVRNQFDIQVLPLSLRIAL